MKLIKAFVFIVFISSQTLFSQNINKCKEVVKLTTEAISTKSINDLESYLAPNFEIANQKEPIAKMVLKQLLTQLNETVISYKYKSSEKQEGNLKLIYTIEYTKMGKKDATFIFTPDNKLQEMTLFKMEVKTADNAKVIKSKKNSAKIPFKMGGNLILVEALLNGVKRNFLLDSGSPRTILNSKYLSKTDSIDKKIISHSKGANGNISGLNIHKVELFEFAGASIKNQELVTLDISHLEKSLKTEVHGLIGYDLIKDYDVLLDYDKNEIIFINPDYYNKYKNKKLLNKNLTVIPFKLENHIHVFKVTIDKKEYSFGLDTGAESNLMDDDLFVEVKNCLKQISTDTLSGASKVRKEVKSGKLKKIIIGGKKIKHTKTVFNDMSHLNEGYKINIDGLVGYEVLSKQKTLISYKRKEMMFIE